MPDTAQILLEGSYLYFDKDNQYSQENFKLAQMNEQQFHIYSEILSRTPNGEFLKVLVRYEMNHQFIPLYVRVEKSIGNKYAAETFKIESLTHELHYEYKTSSEHQEFKKPLSSKHYLSSPAFATSTIFTLTKKFDPALRTPVHFVGPANDWAYQGPPQDRIVWVEYRAREVDYHVGHTKLLSSHLTMSELENPSDKDESPVELFVSKHFGIPYQLTHGDLKIVIKNLKKNF